MQPPPGQSQQQGHMFCRNGQTRSIDHEARSTGTPDPLRRHADAGRQVLPLPGARARSHDSTNVPARTHVRACSADVRASPIGGGHPFPFHFRRPGRSPRRPSAVCSCRPWASRSPVAIPILPGELVSGTTRSDSSLSPSGAPDQENASGICVSSRLSWWWHIRLDRWAPPALSPERIAS
jgi:hypothetical protein